MRMGAVHFPTVAELLAQASAATGLDDFGTGFEGALGVLCDAIASDIDLNADNVPRLAGPIVGLLISRLYSEAGWKRNPQCLARPIRAPLVVTGLPRTGTTALHKLMAMDPQFQGLERWLAETPQPRPPRDTWAAHPDFQACVAGLDMFFQMMPEMRKAHDMVADEVDECLEVLRQDFASNRFGSSMHVPSYDRWWATQDEMPAYRRYVDVLRLVGANDSGQRWLLKNPGHVAQMDCLLEVLSDACVIQTHRDPVKAIPSLCSTLHMARRMFEGDATDPTVLGPREVEYWAKAMETTQRARRSRPDQFFDMDHREFHRDPMGVIRRIYDQFGLTLSDEAAARMQRWIAESPTSKHGEHLYDITDYGITAGQVRSRFADYIARHRLG